MIMFGMELWALVGFLLLNMCKGGSSILVKNILLTEVFEILVHPPLFNWTLSDVDASHSQQFYYNTALKNGVDMPGWIHVADNQQRQIIYLYGVPPAHTVSVGDTVHVQVLATNRRTYETRIEDIQIRVAEKRNPAQYEVHMKIDNINVVDLFNLNIMEQLKHIFEKQLWIDSSSDLYVTFLDSALHMGARKPIHPDEKDGVIIRLGSQAPFSSYLLELQEEVKPLWKVPQCPRDFKRTSVERVFRSAGFAMDWCAFRLLSTNKEIHSPYKPRHYQTDADNVSRKVWMGVSRNEVPERGYETELLSAIVLAVTIFTILFAIVVSILCLQGDIVSNRLNEAFVQKNDRFEDDQQYEDEIASDLDNISAANYKGTNPLQATLIRTVPAGGVHCRPNPPPYMRPKSSEIR